jgi:hypothetical protein
MRIWLFRLIYILNIVLILSYCRKGGGTIINKKSSYWKVALEKGGKMKYAIAIALMLSLSFGLVTESFRYQSTARLWEDDYDLLFDPARIPEIEGSRLWTSLANFVTGNEELFSNGSVPFFLIGGTKNFGKYYPGMVFDLSSDKDALDTGLNDPMGNDIYGEGQVTTINWLDDTLGVYRARTVETEVRQAFDKTSNQDLYVGVGTDLNSLRVGLGFMRNTMSSTYTSPSNNFTYNDYYEDIDNDSLGYQDTMHSAGDDIYKATENEIILSGWYDKERYSLGMDVRYRMLSWSNEAVILGDSAYYSHAEDKTDDYTEAARIDSTMEPESGSRISLNLKAFYDYNDYAQGRYYLGFYTQSVDYGSDAMDYFWEAKREIYADNVYDTATTITYYDGGRSTMGFRVGTKQLFNVTDRFRFAFGFFWNMMSYDDSVSARDTSVTVEVYDETSMGDTLDYTYTEWGSETWSEIRSGSANVFTIPVGVEFNITEPFCFRMGAIHTITKNDVTTDYVLSDWEPSRTRTEYFDTTTYSYEGPTTKPDNYQEIDNETIPATNYYYGIGWRVTNNLQLDFMGFNDLTDMTNWRLSATLHFD